MSVEEYVEKHRLLPCKKFSVAWESEDWERRGITHHFYTQATTPEEAERNFRKVAGNGPYVKHICEVDAE